MKKNFSIIITLLITLVVGSFIYLNKNTFQKMVRTEPNEERIVDRSLTVQLLEQNSSGQEGVAIFEEIKGYTTISVQISKSNQDAQPAHLHLGSCENLGAILHPLTNVVNGKSQTTLNKTIEQLKDDLPLVVNIHESASNAKNFVSCGELNIE